MPGVHRTCLSVLAFHVGEFITAFYRNFYDRRVYHAACRHAVGHNESEHAQNRRQNGDRTRNNCDSVARNSDHCDCDAVFHRRNGHKVYVGDEMEKEKFNRIFDITLRAVLSAAIAGGGVYILCAYGYFSELRYIDNAIGVIPFALVIVFIS